MELTSDFMDVIVGWARINFLCPESVSFFGVSFTVTVPGVVELFWFGEV